MSPIGLIRDIFAGNKSLGLSPILFLTICNKCLRPIEVWKIRVFGTLILPSTIFSEVEAKPLKMKSPNSRCLKNKSRGVSKK